MQPEQGQGDAPEAVDLLWEAFLAGHLDSSGAETLIQHLEKDAGELQRRRSDAGMHACLSHFLAAPEQNRPLVLSVQAQLAGKHPYVSTGRFKQAVMTTVKRKARQHRKRKHPIPWIRILIPAAAALAIIGILATLQFSHSESTGPAKLNSGTPAQPVREARLLVREGRVRLQEQTLGPAESVALPLDTKVRLEPQSVAVVTLSDGSSLELSAQAELTLQGSDHGPRVQLDRGVAQIEVTKQPVGDAFQIQTPFATATDLGTRFTVEAYDQICTISVSEGRVRVSNADAKNKPLDLAAGDELRADSSGLGALLRSDHSRILTPDTGHPKPYTDPIRNTAILGEKFRDLKLQRLTCFSPNTPDAVGYCGWEWPVTLAPDETYVEMWVRPRKVVPRADVQKIPTLVLLANLGTTEYRIGEVQLSSAEGEWVLLQGHLTGSAPVNWIKPGTDRLPLDPEKVLQIEIRNEQADLEFDHSGLILWRVNH
ncbi:MAG TPA: FecR family protein [Patescibacteria group bacterium]|nr:FecR family protein [Patescibacteria group bacterium]